MASGGGSSSTIGATTAMSSAAVLRHLKDLPVRNYEKLPPTPPISMVKPTTATTTEQQAHSPKVAIKQNGHSSTIDECANNSDDALILRIGSLNNKTRHLSSLSINRDTALSREKFKGKIKVRTKTDPHPISSLHRLHDLSGSSTMPTRGSSAHAGSKCNCSSCKSQSSSVSISDNHNKTKSVGTQHDANKAYDPWVRQNASLSKSDGKPLAKTTTGTCSSTSNISSKSNLTQKIQANSNAKVIVITDDFKKKALNQEVFVDTKRKMLRYMKANNGGGGSGRIGENEDVSASKLQDNQKTGKSKSVDNLSQLSIELDQLDNVGSVELIFISDEYLNKVAKPDVIILNNSKEISAYTNRMSKQMSLSGKTNGSHNNSHATNNASSTENGQTSIMAKKSSISSSSSTSSSTAPTTVAAATDASRRYIGAPTKMIVDTTSLSKMQCNENGNGVAAIDDVTNDDANDIDSGVSINGTATTGSKHAKLNRQSSAETSIDDVNNKLTSHAFQSYDEQEHLEESKEIKSPTTENIPT